MVGDDAEAADESAFCLARTAALSSCGEASAAASFGTSAAARAAAEAAAVEEAAERPAAPGAAAANCKQPSDPARARIRIGGQSNVENMATEKVNVH